MGGAASAFVGGVTTIAWPSDPRVSVVSPTITTASVLGTASIFRVVMASSYRSRNWPEGWFEPWIWLWQFVHERFITRFATRSGLS